MNLRIKGMCNDANEKNGSNGIGGNESVNMAVMIGKDKRSKFGDDS